MLDGSGVLLPLFGFVGTLFMCLVLAIAIRTMNRRTKIVALALLLAAPLVGLVVVPAGAAAYEAAVAGLAPRTRLAVHIFMMIVFALGEIALPYTLIVNPLLQRRRRRCEREEAERLRRAKAEAEERRRQEAAQRVEAEVQAHNRKREAELANQQPRQVLLVAAGSVADSILKQHERLEAARRAVKVYAFPSSSSGNVVPTWGDPVFAYFEPIKYGHTTWSGATLARGDEGEHQRPPYETRLGRWGVSFELGLVLVGLGGGVTGASVFVEWPWLRPDNVGGREIPWVYLILTDGTNGSADEEDDDIQDSASVPVPEQPRNGVGMVSNLDKAS